jgi:hypothetical protein
MLRPSGRQLVKKRFGLFQIRRVEALGEPAVDPGKDLASFVLLALLLQETTQAHHRGGTAFAAEADKAPARGKRLAAMFAIDDLRDGAELFVLLADDRDDSLRWVRAVVPDRRYPALSARHPAAQAFDVAYLPGAAYFGRSRGEFLNCSWSSRETAMDGAGTAGRRAVRHHGRDGSSQLVRGSSVPRAA